MSSAHATPRMIAAASSRRSVEPVGRKRIDWSLSVLTMSSEQPVKPPTTALPSVVAHGPM